MGGTGKANKDRNTSVTDVYIAKCIVQLGSLCEQNEAMLEGAEQKLNETAGELTETQQKLNATIVELKETREELNATLDNLKEVLANQNNTWDWNIFLSEQFLNETFTTEHAQLLRSSWEDAAGKKSGVQTFLDGENNSFNCLYIVYSVLVSKFWL